MINYCEVVMADVSIVQPQGGALVCNMYFCVQCVGSQCFNKSYSISVNMVVNMD